VAVKYISRTEINQNVGGDSLLQASADIMNNIVRKGQGWGVNTGAMARLPVTAAATVGLGVAMEDAGYTKFRSNADPLHKLDRQDMIINTGTSFEYDSKFFASKLLWDMRQINDNKLNVTKKIFLGSEISLLKTDLRGGFYQGYWTAGITIRIIPLLAFTATSYGEELDSSAGGRENRVYLVGISLGGSAQGFGKNGKKQKLSLDKY
jgi:hypothetical protein